MNAARAMYPESSSRDMNRYRSRMFGRKTSTLPTPPMTPSIIISLNHPSAMADDTNAPNDSTIHSIHLIGYSPITNVPLNTRYSSRKKIGNANHLCVTIESILSVIPLLFCLVRFLWYVSASAPWIKAYLASTIDDSSPEPMSSLILVFSSNLAAMISSRLLRASTMCSISLSFSRYLIARYRVEYLYLISSVLEIRCLMRPILCSTSVPWLMWICRARCGSACS